MNAMYDMSHYIHLISLIAFILVLSMMLFMHKRKMDFQSYVRQISIQMVFHLTLISFVVLTGAIMMAVKHLSFTPANLLMIIGIIVIAALEIRRNRVLAKASKYKLIGEAECKQRAFKYQMIELLTVLAIGAFSGMASAIPV